MKRILLLITIAILYASTVFASIPKDEVSVAGLHIGEPTGIAAPYPFARCGKNTKCEGCVFSDVCTAVTYTSAPAS